ncbi:hypothetical protein C1280_37040 [Gemmata obscuriglobus]|uniref:Uncharacterized protein n=1 Tax=Gemmata obscuriglobus TaxID=114 RepID=A0A2Z3H5F3_9BACT|nr:hypothetical protein C1280_37040 [Gemmata obscuriglobus]
MSDEYAGKRTKCPSCAAPLTVPAPEVAALAPASEEEAAYRALMDSPEPEPANAPAWSAPRPEPDEPAPKPKPKIPALEKRRSVPSAPRADDYDPPPSRGGGIHISSGVLGGCGMMLGAVVWFGLGWAAGVIYFYPPVLFVFGLVAVVRGLLGHSED